MSENRRGNVLKWNWKQTDMCFIFLRWITVTWNCFSLTAKCEKWEMEF